METNANQKVSCIVNYSYEASEPDELSLRAGDVVREVERLPGGWWRGELRGRRGMFPDNFVSVLTDAGGAGGRSAVQGRCRAVFSYQPANPDELPLSVGDVLDVLGEVEEGWWQGKRQGRVGVFPSNFVVMLDPQPVASFEPAPALPPKPVKEQCRVLFPYSAVNDDELTLTEGDVVTIVSKEAPDRGWWRGELHGRVGLFPDNFVQIVPTVAQDVEEKKPDRPPSKTSNAIYPILNKYSEKTASVKELTTSKISLHKENTINKESSTQSTVTHTNKSESEKLIHSEVGLDGTLDGQKKPPVPLKKSPTPTSAVSGLFSGLKSKMLSTSEKEKEKSTVVTTTTSISSGSNSGGSSGEWDRLDGSAPSKPNNTFDHIERNSILNDPRAGRVKAPRRRPPSQVLRDDTPQLIGLSNGHEDTENQQESITQPIQRPRKPLPHRILVMIQDKRRLRRLWQSSRCPTMKSRINALDSKIKDAIAVHEADKPPAEKPEEIKPRTREWEKHKAPWMAELKLNQAKKTSFAEGKSRSVSSSESVANKAGGSTERILDIGLEEKRSTHSMEMSRSTSSISSRISVLESFDETTKVRHSLDSKKEGKEATPPAPAPAAHSPTAAGRTFTTMLEEIKKPLTPTPPTVTTRTHNEDKSPNKMEKTVVTSEKQTEVTKLSSGVFDKTSNVERVVSSEERPPSVIGDKASTLERRLQGKSEKGDMEVLVAQLNNRITNLEKLLEVQNAKFNAAIEDLTSKLKFEIDKRQSLQAELEKLAHCVTSV